MSASLDKMNELLCKIIEKRNALSVLTYDSEDYDALEEQLHDIEDNMIAEYGANIEKVIRKVYAKFASEGSEVMSPLSYIARRYTVMGKNKLGVDYELPLGEGIQVDSSELQSTEIRVAILPNPMRVTVVTDNGSRTDRMAVEFSKVLS
ncbi:MAG: hypothetical protein EAZ57_09140 [Cytophagales bacterium]|nr:MAG: hypothetical protein EAZ67_09945 [Cytophagales bacterium]TAF59931.1 MAG: hypothetical protein EAZ57_09140 [Cytophagales bacterium]